MSKRLAVGAIAAVSLANDPWLLSSTLISVPAISGKPAALLIGEPHASLADLFAKNSLPFAQAFDHRQLALIRPSGNSIDVNRNGG